MDVWGGYNREVRVELDPEARTPKNMPFGPSDRRMYRDNLSKHDPTLARWLERDARVVIVDEPTRGIDVGAKQEIYHLLNELAAEGKSIIMISSELPEILRMSHRIIVMCEGRVTGELTAAEADQEKIMTLATQRESVAEVKDLSRA